MAKVAQHEPILVRYKYKCLKLKNNIVLHICSSSIPGLAQRCHAEPYLDCQVTHKLRPALVLGFQDTGPKSEIGIVAGTSEAWANLREQQDANFASINPKPFTHISPILNPNTYTKTLHPAPYRPKTLNNASSP